MSDNGERLLNENQQLHMRVNFLQTLVDGHDRMDALIDKHNQNIRQVGENELYVGQLLTRSAQEQSMESGEMLRLAAEEIVRLQEELERVFRILFRQQDALRRVGEKYGPVSLRPILEIEDEGRVG